MRRARRSDIDAVAVLALGAERAEDIGVMRLRCAGLERLARR